MAIKFQCTHCFNRISAEEKREGARVTCPMCETPLTVPAPDPNREFLEQRLVDALDQYKLSEFDRAYARKALELRIVATRQLGKAVVAVRSKAMRGVAISLREEMYRRRLVGRGRDRRIRASLGGLKETKEIRTATCPSCSAVVPAEIGACPHCKRDMAKIVVLESCPACRRDQPSGHQFCEFCGVHMVSGELPRSPKVVCPRCGTQMPGTDPFCPACGRRMGGGLARMLDAAESAARWFGPRARGLVPVVVLLALIAAVVYRAELIRALTAATSGEKTAALKERVSEFDRALTFGDLEVVRRMLDPSRDTRVDEATRAFILFGGARDDAILKVESIDHAQMRLERAEREATVYTTCRVALKRAPASRRVESSADIPKLVAGLGNGSSHTADIAWKWVLRDGKWYYRAPLP